MTADDLQRTIRSIIQAGRDRCGAGFGKYPLGVRDALRELEHLMDDETKAKLKDFDARLAQ